MGSKCQSCCTNKDAQAELKFPEEEDKGKGDGKDGKTVTDTNDMINAALAMRAS